MKAPNIQVDVLSRSTTLAQKWLSKESGKSAAVIALAGLTVYYRAVSEIAKVSGDPLEKVDAHFRELLGGLTAKLSDVTKQ